MAAHLTNTFLLMGALTLTAWWSEGAETPRLGARPEAGWVGATLVATLVLGAGGAVTALGDTLVLGGGLDPETDPIVATLLGARVFHPTMAFLTLAVLGAAVIGTRSAGRTKTLGMALVGGFLVQMAMGALNVALLAPIWLQVLHLLMTDLIWIGMVIWASEVLAAPVYENETGSRDLMCLVTFALDAHPRHRLVLAGNRDEAFARPAAPLDRWPDALDVVAGRDLEAGGTWLGVAEAGRWAVLTNVRDPLHPRPHVRSRGALAADFLRGSDIGARLRPGRPRGARRLRRVQPGRRRPRHGRRGLHARRDGHHVGARRLRAVERPARHAVA